jgi:hypothetical protein
MRKALVIVGIIVLVLLVAVLIFAATFNVNQYHGMIQSELEKHLGRQVSLGDMRLGIFPPRFEVESVSVADDPRFNRQKPFVQAERLDVSVKLLPLLHKDIEVDSLTLERPAVDLIKNRQGVWNFASIGSPSQPSPEPSPSGQPSSAQQFSLGKLVIQDGQVALTDLETSPQPSVYDHIDVTLTNFTPGEPFTLDAAVDLPGPGTQEVRLEGKGGPLVRNDPAATPFQGTLDLRQVGISGLAKFLNSEALTGTDGTITGQTDIHSTAGTISAKGLTSIQNVRLKGNELGYPITADYDLSHDVANSLLTIRSGNVKLGPAPFLVTGSVNMKPTPAQIDLNLKAHNVTMTELAKLAATSGVALAPGTNVTGIVNADVEARGSVAKPALNGTITAQNLQMTGKDIAEPVEIQSVNLHLTPTQIQSAPFQVVSGGTTVNTEFTLQQYLSNNPTVNATVKAPNAQLQNVLSMARAYGIKGLDKISGNGTINLDMHAIGPLKSLNSESIMRALNGTTTLNIANLRYTGVDLGHELGGIAGFLNKTQAAKGYTDVSPLTGNIVVKNGVAQTNNLEAKLDIGSIAAVGTENLANNALNMHLTAVLNSRFSQAVGGTGIGGFMKTALANNQGELAIPVLVTGTAQHPIFAPDVQQMTQMRLKNLIPNSTNPGGVVGGLLGGLLGKNAGQMPGQNQPAQQPGQSAQQNAVQQLMGILGGKKKQQNPPK